MITRPGWARSARVIATTSFRAAPLRATTVLSLTVLTGLSETMFSWFLKLLIDAALDANVAQALAVAGLIGASVAVSVTAGVGGFLLEVGLRERVGSRIDEHLIELTADLPGLEHHERPEYLDEIELLRQERESLTSAIGAIVQNVSMLVRIGGTILLLSRVHPLLLALPLFGLPSLWASGRAQRLLIKAQEEIAPGRRLGMHLFDLATTAVPGKELRIFGLGDELLRRHEAVLWENDRIAVHARAKGAAITAMGWFIFAVGYVAALIFVVARAINGQTTLGEVFLAVMLAQQINNQISGASRMVGWMLNTLKIVARYVWLTDYAKEQRRVVLEPADPPHRIERGITFSGVAFRYPGTEVDVLRDVNLEIPAGSTVAIVGDNGAGKTTLVKLLCRFYEPVAGSITVDGVELRRIDHEAWRARIAAGFQDFSRFEFLAREVVGVGALASIEDVAAVDGALVRASARDVIDELPDGMESALGRSFDGLELSGGQWQKLALGRAMMRPDPLLLVLDEPTAALDAQTEHALFERYAGAAGRTARETGAITVFVSHRFSTVRMADIIVVIDGGKVAESGSHEELMARGGLYAELYEMQARAYR